MLSAKTISGKGTRLIHGILAVMLVLSFVAGLPVQPVWATEGSENSTVFAVVTDYGYASDTVAATVADMVNGWDPKFVVTAGDNYQGINPCNASCYQSVVGAYYGPGAVTSGRIDYIDAGAFWPVPGNHDYSAGIANYSAYFDALPYVDHDGSALFYEFVEEPVHFFMMDSGSWNGQAPDLATQQSWLQSALAASETPWQIVMFHIPAYSAGIHGGDTVMRWPFAEWGADFVISGHNHIYERIAQDGIRYFTAGAAASDTRSGTKMGEVYYSGSGAMRVNASDTSITFEYVSADGVVRDTYTETSEASDDPTITTSASSLNAFTSEPGIPSAEQSYTVSGRNLTGDVTVTPPDGFEISTTSGADFTADPITLSPIEGTLPATSIYVRLNRDSAGSSSGSISHKSDGALIKHVALSGTASDATQPLWVAYNDLAWASGQPSTNITTYTLPGEGTSSGLLVDYATGDNTPVTVSISASGGPLVQTDSAYGGSGADAGTDAYGTFDGIADMAGLVVYGNEGWYVDLEFSGLDPNGSYTFATSANRDGSSYTRNSRFTISGADAAINESTSGVDVINNESVYFNTGYNTENGYVARWVGIKPGSDGSFTVRVEANSGREAYGPSVFMLGLEGEPVTDPTITTSVDSLPAFNSQPGEPSTEQSYTVSAVNLTEDLVISAPPDFEVSTTSGGGFASTIDLTPVDGTIVATTIYARFSRATEGSSAGVINHSSAGASARTVAVSGTAALTPPWTAYNDVSGSSTPPNTTEFTIGTTAGMLLDFDSGDETGATVTVSASGTLSNHDSLGAATDAGTDAYETFYDRVDMGGVVQYNVYDAVDWWMDLTFEGLDPDKTYTFATTANRDDSSYTDRFTRYTISGAIAATNASTPGTSMYEGNPWAVYFCTGANTANGYVARWVNIQPDADGRFTVRAQPHDSTKPKAYAYGMFMLQEEALPIYALTVDDDGNGAIDLDPADGAYVSGTEVTLTPVPNPGYQFDGWTGADAADLVDNGDGTWSISMDGPKSVTATFSAIPPTCYTLTLGHTGQGSDPVASPTNSDGCAVGKYVEGELITLSGAAPAAGWEIAGWIGTADDGSTAAANSLTMPAYDHEVGITYVESAPVCYALTLDHTGEGSNPVASPTSSDGCEPGEYVEGEAIALSGALPATGWRIDGWSGTDNDGSTAGTNSLIMPAQARAVNVAYAEIPPVTPVCYALTLGHSGQGSDPIASPAQSAGCPAGEYIEGASIALSGATPSSGWRISGWTGTSHNGSTAATNSLTMPAGNHAASVVYTEIPPVPPVCYALTLDHTGEGSDPVASPAHSTDCPTGEYVAGEAITLSGALPAAGWRISGWTGTSSDGSTAAANSLIMPAADHTAGVIYTAVPLGAKEYQILMPLVRSR